MTGSDRCFAQTVEGVLGHIEEVDGESVGRVDHLVGHFEGGVDDLARIVDQILTKPRD